MFATQNNCIALISDDGDLAVEIGAIAWHWEDNAITKFTQRLRIC